MSYGNFGVFGRGPTWPTFEPFHGSKSNSEPTSREQTFNFCSLKVGSVFSFERKMCPKTPYFDNLAHILAQKAETSILSLSFARNQFLNPLLENKLLIFVL